MTSPDGMCKSFDSTANGYARAEGIACVVIKRQMEGARSPAPSQSCCQPNAALRASAML